MGIILAAALFGCQRRRNELAIGSTFPTVAATIIPNLTERPSSTPSPLPTSTATVTFTPIPTASPHPMSIAAARMRAYPGSAITIEATLAPGANYSRYIAWYASDGLKIYGLLTIPSAEMPEGGWPAIVFNHGYIAPAAYRTTERYVAYVDQLARSGYVVFKIDYRGHDRSEGVARGAYGDPGYTTDVLNAVASLKAFPPVNPQKIGMWGHSMGGFLTLRAMVISKDIKAGVIWAGVVGPYTDMLCCWPYADHLVSSLSPDPDNRFNWRVQWVKLYGNPEQNPDFWKAISANSYLADLSGPLQIQHDTGDSEVPVQFSQDLYQEILDAGKTAEYYHYPGDDHDIANYFNLAMQRTIEFFDHYLKNGG